MSARWTSAEIHAFVDGELDATRAAQMQADARDDAELAAHIARQRELRARLGTAFDPVLDEPVPAQLLRVLEGGSGAATPISAARRRPARLVAPRPLWWGAAAAGVLVAALLGWSMPRHVDAPLVSDEDGLLAAGALAEALTQRIAATRTSDAGVLVALTFRALDGRYCRVFSLDSGIDGLACRSGETWRVESIGRSPAGDTPVSEYRQASSALSPSVLTAITRWQAGDALTPEEERRIRDAGWRQP